MSQKRHPVDQIIAKLRRADVLLGKGTNVPELCKQLEISEQTYLLLATEVWWHAAGDGQGTQSPAERERSAEKDGCREDSQYGDFKGSHEGKLVSPERRHRTTTEVRRRLGAQKVLERRVCRVLDQPRSTQRNQSRGWTMNHVHSVKCVFWLGDVHVLEPSGFTDCWWNVASRLPRNHSVKSFHRIVRSLCGSFKDGFPRRPSFFRSFT